MGTAQPPDMTALLIDPLANLVTDDFHCHEFSELLSQTAQDPTKYGEAVDILAAQVSAARNSVLFPHQPGPVRQPLSDEYLHKSNGQTAAGAGSSEGGKFVDSYVICWERLVSDAGNLAIRLYRAYLALPETRATRDRVERRLRAGQTLIALRFMLLARLYGIRTNINENASKADVFADPSPRPMGVVKRFRQARRQYDKQVRSWRLSAVLQVGERSERDAAAYNVWRADFGRARDGEIGWAPFARASRIELRYQRYKRELYHWWQKRWHRRSGLRAPLGFLGAVALTLPGIVLSLIVWAFGIVSNVALRPTILAFMSSTVVPIFTALYFVDGLLNTALPDPSCVTVTWSLASVARQAYLAIVNLTSLGANAATCGPFTGVIVGAESLTGYFLLSLLAALLFEWLFDR